MSLSMRSSSLQTRDHHVEGLNMRSKLVSPVSDSFSCGPCGGPELSLGHRNPQDTVRLPDSSTESLNVVLLLVHLLFSWCFGTHTTSHRFIVIGQSVMGGYLDEFPPR